MKLFKSVFATAVLGLGLSVANSAIASPQLAKQYKCLECHVVDKKVIGPSLRDISKKYKGEPGAVTKLSDKVRSGSVGTWGTVPMQAYPDIPQKDLESIINWMLDR